MGEEIGCVGSGKADMTFFEDCRFVIEPDRKGHQDLITSISFTSLCSVEFIKDTHYEKFGYKECDGMMTDILELKERGLNISCINLSCGYYKPHTDEEYTVKKDLLGCLKFVEYIIENCQKVYPHTEELGYNRFDRDLEDLEYELFDILDMSPEITADDLYEMYQTNYPLFSREDFHAIYNEFHLLYMNDYDYEEIGLYNNNQNMELWKSVNMTD